MPTTEFDMSMHPHRTSLPMLVESAHGIVFDKDGTLIDLDARWVPFFTTFIDSVVSAADGGDALRAGLMELLGVTHVHLVADGHAAVATGDHIGSLVIDVLVTRGCDRDDAIGSVVAAGRAARFGDLMSLGDVAAGFAVLLESGRRLGVATSDGRLNTLEELDLLGVSHQLDAIACGDDQAVKPDAAVLLGIGEMWGMPPSRLLYVGDSAQDLATARHAGVAFVGIHDPNVAPTSLCEQADACISTIDELAAVAHRLGP